MDTDKAAGTLKEVAGNVQNAVGDLIGDSATQLAGKSREVRGRVQQLCGDATSMIRQTAAEKPFAALAVVAAASFVVGAIWRAGGSRRDER